MKIGNTDASVAVMSGTSMAAPLCAGAAAMVREYFVKGFSTAGMANASMGFSPSAALVKAVMIHSAQPVMIQPGGRPRETPPAVYETQYPNMQSGYGQVQLSSILQFTDSSFQAFFIDRQELENGKRAVFCFRVHNSDETANYFRVSLVWTDPPGDPTSSRSLVNDLDLVVLTPNKTTFLGNAFSQTDETHGAYAMRDSVNNAEQVRIQDHANGIYSVYVHAREVAIGPQKFALVASASSTMSVLKASECTPPSCPNACSGRGRCLGSGICVCPLTHGGDDCAIEYKVLLLQTQANPTSTALSVTWLGTSYYTFQIADGGSFALSIVKGPQNARSDADFYLAKDRIPTLNDHDAAIADAFSAGTFQSLGNAGGFWIMALLAYEGDVQVSVVLATAKDASVAENVFSAKTVLVQESANTQNASAGSMPSQELTCSTACDCKVFTTATGSLADRSSSVNEYDNNLGCWWMIVPDEADAGGLVLQFNSFVTEGYYDTVVINECFDALCRNISEIEVISGTNVVIPYTVSTSARGMLLRFDTDDSATYRGFSGTWWTLPPNSGPRQVLDNTTGGAFVKGLSGTIASDVLQNYRWIIGDGTMDTTVSLSYTLSAASAGSISIHQCASLDWSLIANTTMLYSHVPTCLGPTPMNIGVRNVQDTYNVTGIGTIEVVFQRNLSQTNNHFEASWHVTAIQPVIQHTPEPSTLPAISTCSEPLCARFTYETPTGLLQLGTESGTYAANTDYTWTISVDRSQWIRLRFSWFDIEKNYDVVRLYQCTGIETGKQCVDDASWTLFATLSGSLADSAVAVSMHDGFVARGAMRVHFTSDSTIEKRGFEAVWMSSVERIFTTNIDTIFTPNVPQSMFMELWHRFVDSLL